MQVTTIQCDLPYVSIIEKEFFACLFFQRNQLIQYLVYKQYVLNKGKFELKNTFKLQIQHDFFMSDKNLHYFYDEFQNSLMIFINEYAIHFQNNSPQPMVEFQRNYINKNKFFIYYGIIQKLNLFDVVSNNDFSQFLNNEQTENLFF